MLAEYKTVVLSLLFAHSKKLLVSSKCRFLDTPRDSDSLDLGGQRGEAFRVCTLNKPPLGILMHLISPPYSEKHRSKDVRATYGCVLTWMLCSGSTWTEGRVPGSTYQADQPLTNGWVCEYIVEAPPSTTAEGFNDRSLETNTKIS